MKKSLKVALVAVCLIAAGAFFMGCSSPAGGDGGSSSYIGKKAPGTVLAVGDIVFNDGSATSYSVIDARTEKKCTKEEKAAAIAVIFRVGDGTEGNKTLGVGIKHERNGLKWCIKDAAGYGTNFTDTVCDPDGGTEAPNLTFKNSPNTDGSKNLGKMVLTMDKDDDTKLVVTKKGEVFLTDKKLLPTLYTPFKNNYPAFEFAYYYGLNYGHNITHGSVFENGWYLPSLSELNDIYQANKTDSVIENALDVTGGNKFEGSSYWSSSQYASNVNHAYFLNFHDGGLYNVYKCIPYFVCAVRAFN